MHVPVHSPWHPGYIDVAQTVLVILTVAGLFPDRPSYITFAPFLLIYLRCSFFFIYLFYLFIFREREGEKQQCVLASCVRPTGGPGPKPRHVPQLGIELATLWFTARAQSTELHQPGQMFLISVPTELIHFFSYMFIDLRERGREKH